MTADRLRRYAQTHHALAMMTMDTSGSASVVATESIEHATKATSAFEILQDYDALTIDDTLNWMRSEMLLATHHANQGDHDVLAKHLDSVRRQHRLVASQPLNVEQSVRFERLGDAITHLQPPPTTSELIGTIDMIAPTDIESPATE